MMPFSLLVSVYRLHHKNTGLPFMHSLADYLYARRAPGSI